MDMQSNQLPSEVNTEERVSPIPSNPVTPIEMSSQFPNQSRSSGKNIGYLALSLILMGGLVGGLLTFNSSADLRSKATNNGPTLALSPSTQSKAVGSTMPVGITINTHDDTVSAAVLKLSYDPTAIQIVSFTAGTPLPVVLVPEVHTNGIVSVTLGVQPATPFKGAGIVGTIQVKVLAAKDSNLRFTNATQVAAVGKTTNALVSAIGSTIMGIAARTPTPTPTRIPGSTNTPTPTRYNSPSPTPTHIPGTTNTPTPVFSTSSPRAPVMRQKPMEDVKDPIIAPEQTDAPNNAIETTPSEEYSPFATMPKVNQKQTVFTRMLDSLLKIFNKIFEK